MTDQATPAKVRLTDGLGPLPERVRIDPEPYGHRSFAAMGYTADQMRAYGAQEVAACRVGDSHLAANLVAAEADRDMLRDALAALVTSAEIGPMDEARWHALEDARQALAQAGGHNVEATGPPRAGHRSDDEHDQG